MMNCWLRLVNKDSILLNCSTILMKGSRCSPELEEVQEALLVGADRALVAKETN